MCHGGLRSGYRGAGRCGGCAWLTPRWRAGDCVVVPGVFWAGRVGGRGVVGDGEAMNKFRVARKTTKAARIERRRRQLAALKAAMGVAPVAEPVVSDAPVEQGDNTSVTSE